MIKDSLIQSNIDVDNSSSCLSNNDELIPVYNIT